MEQKEYYYLTSAQKGVLWMLAESKNIALHYAKFKWRYIAVPQGWRLGKPAPGVCRSLAERGYLELLSESEGVQVYGISALGMASIVGAR